MPQRLAKDAPHHKIVKCEHFWTVLPCLYCLSGFALRYIRRHPHCRCYCLLYTQLAETTMIGWLWEKDFSTWYRNVLDLNNTPCPTTYVRDWGGGGTSDLILLPSLYNLNMWFRWITHHQYSEYHFDGGIFSPKKIINKKMHTFGIV